MDISFIHVFPSFWKDWLSSGLEQKEALQRLELWQKNLLGKTEQNKLFVKVGNPADHILREALRLNPDVIMMGGKNAQTEGRYKSASTAETVVRQAKIPVLLSKPNKLEKILCGIDFSEASGKALEWAIDLAKTFNSHLSLVSVIPKAPEQAIGMDNKDIAKAEAQKEKEVAKQMEELLKKYDFTGINYDKQITWGHPSHIILNMAEDFCYDIIVIGATGHSKLEHVIIGSTCEKILRFSPCSLFVV